MAFIALGDVVAAALLETGRFSHADARYVWGILAGSGVGLLVLSCWPIVLIDRRFARDTRTPLRYALVGVALTTALGYLFAIPLPRALGIGAVWGAAGLTASAGIAGWIEMLMLRRTLNLRIGHTGLDFGYVAKLWTAALAGTAVAWVIKLALPSVHPAVAAVAILGPYGLVFLASTVVMGLPEALSALSRLRRSRDAPP